ncbi:MAG TPA: DUF4166 domain-containing protein, partial [Thermoanaerobaculia bacterium]|nr:DUF4166 domain-containing protein [Thermoanaerobaculia bacterium]
MASPARDGLTPVVSERPATGLYPSLLGAAWNDLPEPVRRGHDTSHPLCYCGALSVRGGRSAAARLVAALLRLPRPGEGVPVRLVVTPEVDGCCWRRTFGARTLVTRQCCRGGQLVERFGILDLCFVPLVKERRLRYRQTAAALRVGRLRLPLPRPLMPVVAADAWVAEGESEMRIEIRITAPLVGIVLEYGGAV